jgi:phosphate transport system protein
MIGRQSGRRSFNDELEALQDRLLEMAGIVERVVAESSSAVLTRDASAAERIKQEDDRIDSLEVEIDERVVELLALQQPMASVLRQIIATNKVSNDLERVGDHAVNMAKAARRLADTNPLPAIREISEMVEITREMLSDALAAYVARNPVTARMVCATDDKVDDLRRSVFRILVTHMLEDPKRIGGALELLLVSQNLERIADLATNIAEDVVFLVEGRMIKHGHDTDEADALA